MNDEQIITALVQGDASPLAEYIYRTIPPNVRDKYLPHLAAIVNSKAAPLKKAAAMKSFTEYLTQQKVLSPSFSFTIESIVSESWDYVAKKKRPQGRPSTATPEFLKKVQQTHVSIDSLIPEKDTVKLYEAVKKGTAHRYHMVLKQLESPEPDDETMEILGVKLPNFSVSDIKFDKMNAAFGKKSS